MYKIFSEIDKLANFYDIGNVCDWENTYYHIGAVRNLADDTYRLLDGTLIPNKYTERLPKKNENTDLLCLNIRLEVKRDIYNMLLYPVRCTAKSYCFCEISK